MKLIKLYIMAILMTIVTLENIKATDCYILERNITDQDQIGFRMTCYGAARQEFQDLFSKNSMNVLKELFSPTMEIKEKGGRMKIYFSYGSNDLLVKIRDISEEELYAFPCVTFSTGWLKDHLTIDDFLPADFSAVFLILS